MTPTKSESRPHLYIELTEAEKAEVLFRGFPRGPDIRYILKPGVDAAHNFALVRWEKAR